MELALKIFQFILSISILVFLHELGHYLPAKWFKTRAEKFFLFFDPWFSIFSMKKIQGKWRYKFFFKNQPDTEKVMIDGQEEIRPIDLAQLPDSDWRKYPESTKWGIGWLPMGGYVKIAGMVDESMDTEQLKKPAKSWEFRSKPAWQRLIIMLGGVLVNFFLAWVIYSCLSFFKGETYIDLKKFSHGIEVTPAAEKMGFKQGDKILAVDGSPVERFNETAINILFSDEVTVQRDGKELTFPVNEEGVAEVIKQRETKLYISPIMPMQVEKNVGKNSVLKENDVILAINGTKTPFIKDVNTELQKYKNQNISVEILRDQKNIVLENISINENGHIGVMLKNPITTKKYSFFETIPRGFVRTIESLTMQVKQFKIIFNTKTQGYKNVGGPIAIVNQMHVDKDKEGNLSIDWGVFWTFTAMFSVWLAFLNLIPIPGLDGGHVLFTLWEIITRKPVPQKVLENAQMIGVFILLGLMVLIFGNDIFKLFMK